MATCRRCTTDKCPNRGEINTLEKRVRDILAGYHKDKKFWRKVFKYMSITLAILMFELILALAKGKEGVMLSFELIGKIFTK